LYVNLVVATLARAAVALIMIEDQFAYGEGIVVGSLQCGNEEEIYNSIPHDTHTPIPEIASICVEILKTATITTKVSLSPPVSSEANRVYGAIEIIRQRRMY